MAHRGAKPALKAIKGGLDGIPPLPTTVHESMADEWQAIALDLKERKLLARPMLGALESYVMALWSSREAAKAIETHGLIVNTAHGTPKANPASALLTKSQTTVARLAAELGITPAARSRSGMGGDDAASDDHDALGL